MPVDKEFSAERTSTGDFEAIYDLDTIYESIKSILINVKRGRPFQPEFGSNLYRYIFEQLDSTTLGFMEQEISRLIQLWEPRITVLSTQIEQDTKNKNVSITISFTYQNHKVLKKYTFGKVDFVLEIPTFDDQYWSD